MLALCVTFDFKNGAYKSFCESQCIVLWYLLQRYLPCAIVLKEPMLSLTGCPKLNVYFNANTTFVFFLFVFFKYVTFFLYNNVV